MRCPRIRELPPPPEGKTGWPWTEDARQLADAMPDGSNWPTISVVTPSLNQGQFIEKTIRSMLLQGYPHIEYIIMDGGSSDGSIEIIKKYEKWLTHWYTGPDRGQSHAINKGFRMANGNILAWLNSDDHYCQEAFFHISTAAQKFEDYSAIVGACRQVDHVYKRTSMILPQSLSLEAITPWYFAENQIAQPSCFMMSWAVKKAGQLREDLHYVFDYEYWLRLLAIAPFLKLEKCLSEISVHPGIKPIQSPGKSFSELIRVMFETGNEEVATKILESTWKRKHKLEEILFKVNRLLPAPLFESAVRILRRAGLL